MGEGVPEGRQPSRSRPVAEAFDLVLSEYSGYTDETILNLTMDRFRQMVEVIAERKAREMETRRKWDLQVAEIIVKSHGSLLAGLAKTKKQANSITQTVQKMQIADLLDSEEEQGEKREDRVPTDGQVFAAFGLTASGLAGVK